jgi:O-antigen/teichoic acid export membrane protein
MVVVVSLLLQSLGCNGFIEAIIQKKEINDNQVSTLFWINAGLSLFLMLLFAVSAPIFAWFYKEPLLEPIVGAIAITIFLGGLSNQHVGLLTRKMDFIKVSVNEMVAALASAVFSIVLAYLGWGYWALVSKWILAPLMITLGAWYICSWRPSLPKRSSEVWPMLSYAFHTYGSYIMNYLLRNMDKILIGWSYGSQPLGYYDRAYHLSYMLPNQLVSPVSNVALSAFSRMSDDHEKFRDNYLNVLSVLAFVGMPASAALTINSNDLILLLLGRQWSESAKIFFAFGPSIGIVILYATHGWLHLSLGTPERWFRWGIISFTVTVLFFIMGLPFGAIGVAIAYSISFYILIGPALWYAGKPIHLKLSSVLSRLWKYYIAALTSGTFCWIILNIHSSTSNVFLKLNILARISVSVLLCLALYLVIISTLYRSFSPITQFTSFIREIIERKKNPPVN